MGDVYFIYELNIERDLRREEKRREEPQKGLNIW
jgi:hypothetical protein